MKKDKIREKMLIKAVELLSSGMPRNTNWHSAAARKRAAEIIVDMIWKDFEVKIRRN